MKKLILIQILFTSVFLTSCGVGSVDCGDKSVVFGLAFCETKKSNRWDRYVGTYSFCGPMWWTNYTEASQGPETSKETVLVKFILNTLGENQATFTMRKDLYDTNNCTGSSIATETYTSPILLTYKNTITAPALINIDSTSQPKILTFDLITSSLPKITNKLSGSKVINGCINSYDASGKIYSTACENTLVQEASSDEGAIYFTEKSFFFLSYQDSLWQTSPKEWNDPTTLIFTKQ